MAALTVSSVSGNGGFLRIPPPPVIYGILGLEGNCQIVYGAQAHLPSPSNSSLDNICCNRYCCDIAMSTKLQSQTGQASLEEKTFLELVRTADRLSRGAAALLKRHELSPTQYNVLRILRGSPEGLPCGEIGRRLITREPDITRLLDRMEKRGLISRHREIQDRRTVLTHITKTGLETVNELDEPVEAIHRKQLGHMRREGLLALASLLRQARRED